MSAANRLREARLAAGYSSASKAADALGIGASTYTAHENGQNAFTVDHAQTYAKAFNVSPSWLFFGETARTAPSVVALVRVLERKGLLTDSDAREVFEMAAMLSDKAV